MGGSYYPIPCLILSIEKDRKTLQRYPDVPTTSWRISIRSMDLFQGLTLKSPIMDRSLAPSSNLLLYVDCTHRRALTLQQAKELEKIRKDNAWMAMSKRARSTRGQASSSHEETMEEKINEPIFCELVREFFASFEFDSSPCRYDLLHKGVTFRLRGVEREMSLLELGWRVGLYSERESRDVATLSKLRGALTANSSRLNHLFWPSIDDGGYNVGNTKAKSIRNPRIRHAHRCITMTITGRKETTHRVTKIDLFYLYCIFGERIVCNIPYWLAKYLKSVREKGMIFRGMFVTKIARSFGLLTEEMVSVLSREPPPHVYRKTSLIKMGVIMELHEGECFWLATREVVGEGKAMMRKAMEKG
ncbi:hypothetical protein Tco_0622844 [Tanacetum coccineum]